MCLRVSVLQLRVVLTAGSGAESSVESDETQTGRPDISENLERERETRRIRVACARVAGGMEEGAAAANAAGSSSAVPAGDAEEIKLIFLDIDGVICCNGMGRLEPDKLARIGEVVKRTDARIVLSTDWRRDPNLKAICTNALEAVGCTVIGATRKGPPLQPIRPKEIWGWLQSYQNEKGKRVTQWVAVDDRQLLMEQGGENLRGHVRLASLEICLRHAD